jgi:hypothetical protein
VGGIAANCRSEVQICRSLAGEGAGFAGVAAWTCSGFGWFVFIGVPLFLNRAEAMEDARDCAWALLFRGGGGRFLAARMSYERLLSRLARFDRLASFHRLLADYWKLK